MMAKMPFTSQGVADKVKELYRLGDPELTAEAKLIKQDVRLWLNNNFILDANQRGYLSSMDNEYVSYIGFNLSIAVQHRLEVSMNLAEPDKPWVAKWLTAIVSYELKYTNGHKSVGGLFHLIVNYS